MNSIQIIFIIILIVQIVNIAIVESLSREIAELKERLEAEDKTGE